MDEPEEAADEADEAPDLLAEEAELDAEAEALEAEEFALEMPEEAAEDAEADWPMYDVEDATVFVLSITNWGVYAVLVELLGLLSSTISRA